MQSGCALALENLSVDKQTKALVVGPVIALGLLRHACAICFRKIDEAPSWAPLRDSKRAFDSGIA